ncbi:beta-N-acetylhexosaminidase [Maribacter sp.]|uniref:beta-N-acetylhexosaminidase n=1 Tax=Maribacter sp. TaxID=1897614 RepID=UPI0025C1FEDD|nr:beta-N-acetylhexosaminidase [Maribacter sp.]
MRYFLTLVVCSIMAIGCTSQKKENWKIIPYPNSISIQPGYFTFKKDINIVTSDSILNPVIRVFEKKINEIGITISNNSKRLIEIELSTLGLDDTEAYKLEIDRNKIKLTAENPKGVFYGLMTIWQGVKLSNSNAIPCGLIKDKPRYVYRGFMLDESRHFFGKEKVKQIINLMSELKLNTFHWHLTDAPGWRIEIKAFPKLTTIGGQGNHTDPNAPAKYYTQEEIKEIVAYAAERFVTIIPEIDMPGHATAANKAYPEYSGGGSEKHPEFTFNPGKESTYAYLTTILRETASLFPSEYIHIGGDEVHFGNAKWVKDAHINSLIKREGLTSMKDVENYFIRRMADSIVTLNKKVAGWDEITKSGVDKENLLIYWWRHNKPGSLDEALNNKYSIVLCPRIPLYLDFIQHKSHKNGRIWDGKFSTLDGVYHYPDSLHTFTTEDNYSIKGIQGCLWTEKVKTNQQIDFMTYPRIFALSESAWTENNNKNYIRFKSFLPSLYDYLDEQKIYYFNGVNDTLRLEPEF